MYNTPKLGLVWPYTICGMDRWWPIWVCVWQIIISLVQWHIEFRSRVILWLFVSNVWLSDLSYAYVYSPFPYIAFFQMYSPFPYIAFFQTCFTIFNPNFNFAFHVRRVTQSTDNFITYLSKTDPSIKGAYFDVSQYYKAVNSRIYDYRQLCNLMWYCFTLDNIGCIFFCPQLCRVYQGKKLYQNKH